ncbi:transposase [Actinoplanes siamensis]|uniref:Transposase IS116/IS110/IS902 C-terminal domain-containing protein n=1 Tax=Actinoplanes siamensis TaxID=1223317 RepID=A0A919N622_9ACTN|nr:transposase [Actinoplanes siamensis]GIF05113.1 hypothetical protein Asi03nite_26510 [Actinoplanes siamensis]
MGTQALALLATLNVECASVDQLAETASAAFRQHPDHAIVTSFPGLADVTGARVLAEIGDDRARFADARALKAYAGAAPVTRACGRSISITHRKVKTTGSPQPVTCGRSSPPPMPNLPSSTTNVDATTATGIPQRCATCSTGSSAACTTAWQPASSTTPPRRSLTQRWYP